MADIVILGAGPVGLTAALLLAQADFDVLLLDARDAAAPSVDRRLLALSRGTWQALQPLLAQPPSLAPIEEVKVSSAGEFGVTRIADDDFDGVPLGWTVYYGDLVTALQAAAAHQPRIAVRWNASPREVRQRHAEVEVLLGADERIVCGLLVHAEGGESDARDAAGWAVVGEVLVEGLPAATAIERFTREGPLALLPGPRAAEGGKRWSLVWCADEPACRSRASMPPADWLASLNRALGLRGVRAVGVAPGSRPAAVPLRSHSRRQVYAHRQVWLGNAAQTLHPVAGQGYNLGVRDCLTLVDSLATLRGDLPAALQRHAQRRAADRAVIGAVTRWLPPLFATRFAPLSLLRSAGLVALDLAPAARRQWARLLMFGVRE
jgi:2-octaprenyl-6-methoxyphenol hydroxylase